jgi:hypothetical protein
MKNLGHSCCRKALYFSVLALAGSTAGAAAFAAGTCPGEIHVHHTVAVDQSATCVLSKLYEPQKFCLRAAGDTDPTGIPFDVIPGTPATFGMTFFDGADFNMEYGLTCVAKDGAFARSPKVIFTIGADGPGTPVVSLIGRDGGEGAWMLDDGVIKLTAHF